MIDHLKKFSVSEKGKYNNRSLYKVNIWKCQAKNNTVLYMICTQYNAGFGNI